MSPAAFGALSASLTAFTRTIDEYNALTRQELNPAKQEKAYDRIRNFRTELSEFRAQYESLKTTSDDVAYQTNRSELLGRRPYAAATPENPYATTSGSAGAGFGGGGNGHSRTMSTAERGPSAAELDTRESHALREQSFFANTNSALDDYIARGQAVMGDLSVQREMLKNTQKRVYTVANTLGISGDTIRMVERRAREDKWIFLAGVIVFFLFCWLCIHFLR